MSTKKKTQNEVPEKPVRKNFKYGKKPATEVIHIRLTEVEKKKLLRKVKDRTITEYFKKVCKL